MRKMFLSFYSKGFLPGPIESESNFYKRAALTEKIVREPKNYITEKSLKNKVFSSLNESTLFMASSCKLFWHASVTMILEISKDLYIPIISKPSKFSNLFINEDEVLNHELIHAKRVYFNDEKFEEIIAFRTSKSSWRKFFSPLITKQYQLILILIFSLITSYSSLPFFILLSSMLFNLSYKQFTVYRCIRYLKRYTKYYEEILIGMTDKEIISVANNDIHKIDFSLFRWKYLQSLFGKVK